MFWASPLKHNQAADKIIHSFSLLDAIKLTASQTKTFLLLLNQDGQDNLSKNVIPSTNVSVKLDMYMYATSFAHQPILQLYC